MGYTLVAQALIALVPVCAWSAPVVRAVPLGLQSSLYSAGMAAPAAGLVPAHVGSVSMLPSAPLLTPSLALLPPPALTPTLHAAAKPMPDIKPVRAIDAAKSIAASIPDRDKSAESAAAELRASFDGMALLNGIEATAVPLFSLPGRRLKPNMMALRAHTPEVMPSPDQNYPHKAYIGKAAWLSDRYKPILQIGIFTGFAAGLAGFAALYPALGGLSILLVLGGVLGGVFAGDRFGRGSAQKVLGWYKDRLTAIPGVQSVAVEKLPGGGQAISVTFRPGEKTNAKLLPQMINGYPVVIH